MLTISTTTIIHKKEHKILRKRLLAVQKGVFIFAVHLKPQPLQCPKGVSNINDMVKKILLAEDDADIRFIVNLVLEDAGYQVEQIATGQDIVEGKHPVPDLFILDKALPLIDGFAICKYLKIKEETKDVPIIMISSYHGLGEKARDLGVDEFVEKPFDVKQLVSLVDKHMQKRNVVTKAVR